MRRLIFIILFSVLAIQLFYIKKLSDELEIRKKISTYEIKQLIELGVRLSPEFENKSVVTTSLDCPKITYLDEVDGYESDIIARIELLEDHLNLEFDKPSSKWIKDVTTSAKNEIVKLRNLKK